MRIFVGNLPFEAAEPELRGLFDNFGEVAEAAVITDRETGRSRGFGFVTMPDDQQAQQAITELAGSEFSGRTLNVNEARPRETSRSGGRSRW